MKKIFLIKILILVSFFCGKNEKIYLVTGTVKKIDITNNKITVDHDSIPGYMIPMVMPFNIKNKNEIKNISVNDSIQFSFIVGLENYSKDFKVISKNLALDQDWDYDDDYEEKLIGDYVDDINLLTLDSNLISINNNKYKLISFIFSRCPITTMCPAVIIKNSYISSKLHSYDNLDQLIISFDYLYDTPSVMSEKYGLIVNDKIKFLSSVGRLNDLYKISVQTGFEFSGVEENNIGHNLRTILLDNNLKILEVWKGDDWLASEVSEFIELYLVQ